MSKPKLAWLTRPASHSTAQSASTATPSHQRYHSVDYVHNSRGAVVVRTPNDALREFKHKHTHSTGLATITQQNAEDESFGSDSPPLPPLPIFPDHSHPHGTNQEDSLVTVQPRTEPEHDYAKSALLQPHPTHPPADPLKQPPSIAYPIPPLPAFSPILLSESALTCTTNILITLETNTQTFRTTFTTLASRSSLLSHFLRSLLPAGGKAKDPDDSISVYSGDIPHLGLHGDDSISNVYRSHLEQAGLLPAATGTSRSSSSKPHPTPIRLHIFLDRPTEAYPNILAYLRSIDECLPLTARVHHGASLETLLILREEAFYLGLENLVKLCEEEMDLHWNHFTNRHSPSPPRYSLQTSVAESHRPSHSARPKAPSTRPNSGGEGTVRRGSPPFPDTPVSPRSHRSSHSPDRSSRKPLSTPRTPHSPLQPQLPPAPGWF